MTANRRFLSFCAVVVGLALTLLACDTGNMVALLGAAPTATRTPRPTFTPRPSFTETPEDTPTPFVTDTPIIPEALASPTRRVVATTKPAAPKATTAPPATPKPSFPIRVDESYLCEQPQDAYWKITGRIQRQSDKTFVDGYSLGIFAKDGKFLAASVPSAADYSMTLNGNCKAQNRYLSNVEIDVTQFRMQLPLIIRVIRSQTDHTAVSPDVVADFPQPGNFYVHYFLQ